MHQGLQTVETFDCGSGCLFNVARDPSEYEDLAATFPEQVASLTSIFRARIATAYHPPETSQNLTACRLKVNELDGFLGPYYQFGKENP